MSFSHEAPAAAIRDVSELRYIYVDHLAWCWMLVSANHFTCGSVGVGQTFQFAPEQNAVGGRRRYFAQCAELEWAELEWAEPFSHAQANDTFRHRLRGLVRAGLWT